MTFETDEKHIVCAHASRLHQRGQVLVQEIKTPVKVETPTSLQDNLYMYKARDERFVLVTSDEKYYDTKGDSTGVIKDDMVINPFEELIIALQMLVRHPFLLVDSEKDTEFHVYDKNEVEDDSMLQLSADPEEILEFDELKDEFPGVAEEYRKTKGDDWRRYGIISLSEVNQRQVKEALYPIIAEFERVIANRIREEYPVSEELLEVVGHQAKENWEESSNTKQRYIYRNY